MHVQCVSKRTLINLGYEPSFLNLVITHHCDRVIEIQHLPQLANNDHVVLYFVSDTW